MKIGDRVKIDRVAASRNTVEPFYWYSDEIYTIMNISNHVIVTLDRNLKNCNENNINIYYLKLLSVERKNKLLNLEKFNENR